MIYCPYCGQPINQDDLLLCPQCSQPLINLIKFEPIETKLQECRDCGMEYYLTPEVHQTPSGDLIINNITYRKAS